jgi:hypothetical protein
MRLRGVPYRRVVIEVAVALNLLDQHKARWLLRELGDDSDDPNTNIESAIAAGMLVLAEQPRRAYWRGHEIEFNWTKRSALWAYFWQLCQHANAGRSIDRLVFGDQVGAKYVAQQKSRLSSVVGFPQGLADTIVSAGSGSQTLNIPAETIRIFDSSGGNCGNGNREVRRLLSDQLVAAAPDYLWRPLRRYPPRLEHV